MPFGKQFGFIFKSKTDQETIWTISHELGHGLFKLKHTFDYNEFIIDDCVENLMSYQYGRKFFAVVGVLLGLCGAAAPTTEARVICLLHLLFHLL